MKHGHIKPELRDQSSKVSIPSPISKFADSSRRSTAKTEGRIRRGGLRAFRESGFFNPRVMLASALCSIGVLLAMLSFAAEATGNWIVVTSPSISGKQVNALQSVTCMSASDCWAVGYYYTGTGSNIDPYYAHTLIERWDGTSWAIVTSPNTSATQNNVLSGVTCVSASNCRAVGYYRVGSADQTLIEHWDGTSWAIVTSPNTSRRINHLLGVTCASASECWAVGSSDDGSFTEQTLIERWDGTSWTIVTSPNASATRRNLLNGVTCVSASNCWVVGFSAASNGLSITNQTLIERWNGTSWAIVSSPNTLVTQDNVLSGVTCVSSSDCWAVGYYNIVNVSGSNVAQTLIERWDGTSWAIVTSPNTSVTQTNVLSGVTCVSASNCRAVGYYDTTSNAVPSGLLQTLSERWDGTSWAIVSSPNPSATAANILTAVTCVSASNCWAVGYYFLPSNFISQTLIERWDGTSWAIVTSPNTNTSSTNYLAGVTCVSASDCWAVGYYFSGSFNQTLIERWDGTSWAIVSSPNTSAMHHNILFGVTCASASDCWAVGFYNPTNGSKYQTLIERWDGNAWAIVSSPNTVGTQSNVLVGVTCASASDCWAVGYAFIPGSSLPGQTLIERWNGTSWAIVTSPNASTTQNSVLFGVTCVSASDCWAVGYYGNFQTLIERWDGTSWAIVSSPNTVGTQFDILYSVTCVSASDCWAVGDYFNGSKYQTLIERWDGTSWAIVSSPNDSSSPISIIVGVTCASASECWAVGDYFNGSKYQTLIERWDGTSWAIVTSPNAGTTQNNVLAGVTCVSASDCWAVGYIINGGTLVLRYTAPAPIPTSVVSRKTHGTAGDFDIDLPLTGTRGIECRGSASINDYTLVFSFVNNLTSVASASVTTHDPTSGTGSVLSSSLGPNPNQYTVNLTNVSTGQYITVTLNSVLDVTGASGNVLSPQMGVLVGDVNSTGLVDGNDVSLVQGHARQTANSTNFRLDVNTTGLIDGNDVSLVQSKTRTSLP